MPLEIGPNPHPPAEPIEFSMEDAILNTWVEDSGNYLRLDPEELTLPREALPKEALPDE
jgi:hypothetical protein